MLSGDLPLHLRLRIVALGGVSKGELLGQLLTAGVRLNEAAQALFADPRFTTRPVRGQLRTVEVTPTELGLPEGGTFAQIVERAARHGLRLGPLELGPHLRLQFRDQPEGALGQPVTKHCAPPGSLTVASAPLSEEEEIPKGFYLRRIEGDLWLRGYRAPADHPWSPRDVFVFVYPDEADQPLPGAIHDRSDPDERPAEA